MKYLDYYLHASNGKGHGTHSPFVYHFISSVLNDRQVYPAYAQVETLRKQLLRDDRILDLEDMGAGSGFQSSSRRRVGAIAASAAKPKKLGQLLFRMVKEYQPSVMVELGTSLGITSAYLAMGNPAATFYTLEGAGAAAAVARENFEALGIRNTRLQTGNFDSLLPVLLEQLPRVDFCFIDGNHRQEPTERYFLQLLPRTGADSILVFDDIHWSAEMEAAWKTICSHPEVRCSIDLFFIGIIFFRREFREKQHFRIRF